MITIEQERERGREWRKEMSNGVTKINETHLLLRAMESLHDKSDKERDFVYSKKNISIHWIIR